MEYSESCVSDGYLSDSLKKLSKHDLDKLCPEVYLGELGRYVPIGLGHARGRRLLR